MHGEKNEIKIENDEMGNRPGECASYYKSV